MAFADRPLPPFTLRESGRARHLRITIDHDLGLVVTVPPPTRRGWAHPEARIEAFLRERDGWIRRHLERRALDRAALAARGGLVDGASLPFRGEFHRLRIVPAAGSHSSVARIVSLEGFELRVALAGRDRERIAWVLEGWLREQARIAIQGTIADHATALGVAPKAVALRDPRSRWGSASRAGRLMFSWRLVLAPPEALETVVVHELAHLRVFGHGPRFWALVATRRPDHLVWRGWLRDHSLELHGALEIAPDNAASAG
ncbi:MAG TPA: SprT family zinc-dependent metalloprotease [Candidatus Limnocylindrales bacterium]|nr:SprT family zinc-dependent metalloprotease [Candidatus Limnocylindrales bacterium]